MKAQIISAALFLILGLCTYGQAPRADPGQQTAGDNAVTGQARPVEVDQPKPVRKPLPEWGGAFGDESGRGWGVSCEQSGDCSVHCDKGGCSVRAEEDYEITWADQSRNKAAQCSVGCPKGSCSISCEPPLIGCKAECLPETGIPKCDCIAADE